MLLDFLHIVQIDTITASGDHVSVGARLTKEAFELLFEKEPQIERIEIALHNKTCQLIRILFNTAPKLKFLFIPTARIEIPEYIDLTHPKIHITNS